MAEELPELGDLTKDINNVERECIENEINKLTRQQEIDLLQLQTLLANEKLAKLRREWKCGRKTIQSPLGGGVMKKEIIPLLKHRLRKTRVINLDGTTHTIVNLGSAISSGFCKICNKYVKNCSHRKIIF